MQSIIFVISHFKNPKWTLEITWLCRSSRCHHHRFDRLLQIHSNINSSTYNMPLSSQANTCCERGYLWIPKQSLHLAEQPVRDAVIASLSSPLSHVIKLSRWPKTKFHRMALFLPLSFSTAMMMPNCSFRWQIEEDASSRHGDTEMKFLLNFISGRIAKAYP